MKTYKIAVELEVEIDAFTASDAEDAILEDLQDIAGARVTSVKIVDLEELD